MLRTTCIYACIFESGSFTNIDENNKKRPSPNHPFVIEPPEEKTTVYHPGDLFDFNLILFGKANEYLPYFVYAFEQVGSSGIGKKINGKAGTFRLDSVSSKAGIIYSSNEGHIRKVDAARDIPGKDLSRKTSVHQDPIQITLFLKTPLRLKFQNRLEPELPFHILIRAVNRRISSLFNHFGEGEPDIDYRGLVRSAENVNIADSSIKWFDWRRYSNRQEQAMFMGGMVGEITYEDVPAAYLPLLRFCEEAHLGKQTTFGLGRISLKISNTDQQSKPGEVLP